MQCRTWTGKGDGGGGIANDKLTPYRWPMRLKPPSPLCREEGGCMGDILMMCHECERRKLSLLVKEKQTNSTNWGDSR